jgi:uncharacterized protein (TIGR02145 family)
MKTLLQKKYFPVKYLQKSKFNGVNKIVIIAILFLLTGGLYLNSQAGSFTWLQNSWLGGQSGTTATHSTDANGTWTNYSAKDNDLNINGSGDAQLKKADNWQETTDADFNANTSKDSTLAVTGNSIKLLKADGATCSVAGDCQSNICTGNVCVAAFACGTSTVTYGSQTYNTVQIGAQCWLRENLNAGTQIAGTVVPDNTAPTLNDPTTVSKWCYNDAEANCTADGGLYTWAEANALANSCNTATCTPAVPSQGICPTGWHIPTHNEYTTLERTICTSGTCTTDFPIDATTAGWRGTDEGSKLSMLTLNGNNSSGFTGILPGFNVTGGSFLNRSAYGYIWSASAFSSTDAWRRTWGSGYASIYRGNYTKGNGFSVRCIKSAISPSVTTNSTTTITSDSALGNGNITDTGGENPTRSIEWGTVSGTYTSSCTAGTGGVGTYSCSLTGLNPSTTYYVRAKATNSAGTTYGSEISFTTTAFVCGTSTVFYGGQTYNTVQIGTQCWFKENLNVGTRIAGTAMPTDPAPTLNNPSTVSKWCYGDTETNCTNEGGFYSWAEANALASTCNTTTCTPSVPNQGICPTGWHIPTDAEFKTLEMYLGMTQAQADATGYRGTDQGSKLSMFTLNGNNSSNFTALMAGDRLTDGSFGYRGTNADFSTSSPSSTTTAFCRVLGSSYSTVYRTAFSKIYGFSVRCLKN